MIIVDDQIAEYVKTHTRPEPQLLTQLAAFTEQSTEYPQMLTGRIEGRLLKLLVQLCGAKTGLEIGTFTGYSALSIAEGLPEGGRLITCEINPKYAAIAKGYWAKSPHGEKIEIRLGPALDTIAGLNQTFDLVFIDADKHNYLNYYRAVIEKLNAGGIILIDNALWSGAVLDPQDEESRVIDQLNKFILRDDRVENVLLTVRDGVNLVRKISN